MENKESKNNNTPPVLGNQEISSILPQINQTEQLSQIFSQNLQQFNSLIFDELNQSITGIKFQHDTCNFTKEAVGTEGRLEDIRKTVNDQIKTWLISSLDAIRNHQGEINIDDFPQQILTLHFDIEFSENFSKKGGKKYIFSKIN